MISFGGTSIILVICDTFNEVAFFEVLEYYVEYDLGFLFSN